MDKKLYQQITVLSERLETPEEAAHVNKFLSEDEMLIIKKYLDELGLDMHPDLKTLYRKTEKFHTHSGNSQKQFNARYYASKELEVLQQMAKEYSKQVVIGGIEEGAPIKTSELVRRAIESGNTKLYEQKGYESLEIVGGFITAPGSALYHKSTHEMVAGGSSIQHDTFTYAPEMHVSSTKLEISKKNDKESFYAKSGIGLYHISGAQRGDILAVTESADTSSGKVTYHNKGIVPTSSHHLMSTTVLTAGASTGTKDNLLKRGNLEAFAGIHLGGGIAYTDTRGLITSYAAEQHKKSQNQRLEPVLQLKGEMGLSETRLRPGIICEQNLILGLGATPTGAGSEKERTRFLELHAGLFKTATIGKDNPVEVKAQVGFAYTLAGIIQQNSMAFVNIGAGLFGDFVPAIKVSFTPHTRQK